MMNPELLRATALQLLASQAERAVGAGGGEDDAAPPRGAMGPALPPSPQNAPPPMATLPPAGPQGPALPPGVVNGPPAVEPPVAGPPVGPQGPLPPALQERPPQQPPADVQPSPVPAPNQIADHPLYSVDQPVQPGQLDSPQHMINGEALHNAQNVEAIKAAGRETVAAQMLKDRAVQEAAAAQAPLMQEKAEIAKQQVEAQKQFADWGAQQQTAILSDMNTAHDNLMKLANDNPADLWGHWSTAQKITGIIGIVAAGAAGQDTTQRVRQMATDAVNAQIQKANLYQAIGHNDRSRLGQLEHVLGSRQAAINSYYAALYQDVSNRMQITAQKWANPVAAANLLDVSAKVAAEATNFQQKGQDVMWGNSLKAFKADIDQQEADAHTTLARDPLMKDRALGQTLGRTGFMSPEQKQAFAPVVGGAHTIIYGIDEAEDLLKAYKDHHSPASEYPKLAANYENLRQGTFTQWRKFSGSGAAVSEGEQKNFDSLFPPLNRTIVLNDALGYITGMHRARDTLVQSVKDIGDSYGAGTSEFDPNFPLYKPSLERMATEKADTSLQNKARKLLDQAKASQAEGRLQDLRGKR